MDKCFGFRCAIDSKKGFYCNLNEVSFKVFYYLEIPFRNLKYSWIEGREIALTSTNSFLPSLSLLLLWLLLHEPLQMKITEQPGNGMTLATDYI